MTHLSRATQLRRRRTDVTESSAHTHYRPSSPPFIPNKQVRSAPRRLCDKKSWKKIPLKTHSGMIMVMVVVAVVVVVGVVLYSQ